MNVRYFSTWKTLALAAFVVTGWLIVLILHPLVAALILAFLLFT